MQRGQFTTRKTRGLSRWLVAMLMCFFQVIVNWLIAMLGCREVDLQYLRFFPREASNFGVSRCLCAVLGYRELAYRDVGLSRS